MTPKQLRALDALIGREIMGYNVQPLTNFLVGSMRDDGYDHYTVNEHGDPGVLPLFTTSLDAAMILAGKMRERGWFLEIESPCPDRIMWEAYIADCRGLGEYHVYNAPTPALAVSLAVCEACGVNIKREADHEP
jgi:hypothetical protein